VFCVVIGREG